MTCLSRTAAPASFPVVALSGLALAVLVLQAACSSSTAVPTNLTYSTNPATYTKGVAITPNAPTSGGGAVASYSVSPALPAGLSLAAGTGVISGTPTAVAAQATYTVTATNSGGSTTAALQITVKDVAPSGLVYSVNPAVYPVGTAIAANTPSSSGGAVVSYSISPALPSGLSLASNTGVLSGTPTTALPSTTFTVTATNGGGSSTAGLTITVTSGSLSVVAGTPGGMGDVDGTGANARFYDPHSVAVDGDRNVYVADSFNSTVRKVTPQGVVTTLAGAPGQSGTSDGTGAAARFNHPNGLAVDSSGNVYVADSYNFTIRKITPAGAASTLAGLAGQQGYKDDTGAAARFTKPLAVAVDVSGNLYVADTDGYDVNAIRKITSQGVVTTLAGSSTQNGFTDGTGTAASFSMPSGLAVDASGNVYVADGGNNTIRKITPAGAVSTLAGAVRQPGYTDGTGTAARFSQPMGVAVDGSGYLYVGDGNMIRKITPGSAVSSLAGSADRGYADGTGTAARFFHARGVAVDADYTVYVADTSNHAIRTVTPGGVVATLAGVGGAEGAADGTGAAATFSRPQGVAADAAGNLYVADYDNQAIRKITPAGAVSTLATGFDSPRYVAVDAGGNVYLTDELLHTIRKVTPQGVASTLAGTAGVSGWADGTGAAARFTSPQGLAVDASGNVYVADGSLTIRKITAGGSVTTLAGTPGQAGSADGVGAAARFEDLAGVALDASGNVYAVDRYALRKISPAGAVSTLAGGPESGHADGAGSAAKLTGPMGVAVDASGRVYVVDWQDHTIREITPAGVVSTIIGVPGSAGTFLGPLPARLSYPFGIAVDPSGTRLLYITVADAVLSAPY